MTDENKGPPMTGSSDEVVGLIAEARIVSEVPYSVTYPSRVSADRVRDILRRVTRALEAAAPPSGRVCEATQLDRLMEACKPFVALSYLFKEDDSRKGLAFTTPNLSPSDFRALRSAYNAIGEGR